MVLSGQLDDIVGMNFYDLNPQPWEEADLIPMDIEFLCREKSSNISVGLKI